MIAPTAPYTARGFIWWQGESNAERSPLQYRVLLPGLIQEWRCLWQQDKAPFLYVELANFLPPQRYPVEDEAWPALRDAQKAALSLPHTAMISTIDILGAEEEVNSGHPRHKQLAGYRLALAALAQVYGQTDLIWSGPTFQSVEFEGNQAIVTFDHIGKGLETKDGAVLRGFALAGVDQRFFWAEGKIQDNTVILSSKSVEHPVAVRYGWANNPIGNLYNSAGLPTFPFRSDTWGLGVQVKRLQTMDWQALSSYINRSLPFPTTTQQELWQQVYRSLSDNSKEQSSLLIEQLLQQPIEEEILNQALHLLLTKLNE
jgi:sialate O-acetylesterase